MECEVLEPPPALVDAAEPLPDAVAVPAAPPPIPATPVSVGEPDSEAPDKAAVPEALEPACDEGRNDVVKVVYLVDFLVVV